MQDYCKLLYTLGAREAMSVPTSMGLHQHGAARLHVPSQAALVIGT